MTLVALEFWILCSSSFYLLKDYFHNINTGKRSYCFLQCSTFQTAIMIETVFIIYSLFFFELYKSQKMFTFLTLLCETGSLLQFSNLIHSASAAATTYANRQKGSEIAFEHLLMYSALNSMSSK